MLLSQDGMVGSQRVTSRRPPPLPFCQVSLATRRYSIMYSWVVRGRKDSVSRPRAQKYVWPGLELQSIELSLERKPQK